jgi:hypothetical protein
MLIESHGQPYHCSLILWDVAHCQWVVCYQLFRTIYQSHLRLQNGSEKSFLPMYWNSISVPFQVARLSLKIHSYILGEHIIPISSHENVCDDPFLRFGETYLSHCKGQNIKEEWYLPTFLDNIAWVRMAKKNNFYLCFWTALEGSRCPKKMYMYPHFKTALPGLRYPRRIIHTHITGTGYYSHPKGQTVQKETLLTAYWSHLQGIN